MYMYTYIYIHICLYMHTLSLQNSEIRIKMFIPRGYNNLILILLSHRNPVCSTLKGGSTC